MAEWEGRCVRNDRGEGVAALGMAGRGRCVRSDRGGVFRWWQAMLAGMMVAMLGWILGWKFVFA